MKKLLFVLGFLIFLGSNSKAYASQAIQISPRTIVVHAMPGAQITSSLTLLNPTDSDLTFTWRIEPFKSDENGRIIYSSNLQSAQSQNILDHMQLIDGDTLLDTNFTIPAHQEKTIQIVINLSENQKESDYYFSIIFISQALQPSGNSSTISIGIATNILLSVGSQSPNGFIKEFSAPLQSEKGPIPFRVLVENTGIHALTPAGFILITNMFGQTIGRVNLSNTYVLAGGQRLIPEDFQTLQPQEQAQILKAQAGESLAWWPELVTFGFYKADLYLTLSPNGETVHKTIHFLSFPTGAGLKIVIIFMVLLIISWRAKKYL